MNASKLVPLAVAGGVVALCAAAIAYAIHVPAVVSGSAAPSVFSGERAMQHVYAVARPAMPAPAMRGAMVREYITNELRHLGLEPQEQQTTGVGTRYAVAGPVTNVLVRLPGTSPGGQAVLLMAHYDAVPVSPGAGDDGSGVAVLLETLQALRSGPRLTHDVIALFTDQEESGLLGAAAFVREHPWARDVAVVLNFEARGTHGPSLMFETGPGNLDVARVLRHVRGVRATSLSTAVYRQLPNDTDLSELALLGQPAMNFAFIGGVDRYHTAEDDALHLDPRSVQHHGTQAVALARMFASGELPRPRTQDAVFFDMPAIGLVVYPEAWASIFALVTLVLAALTVLRARRTATRLTRGIIAGASTTLLAGIASALCAIVIAMLLQRLHGASPHGGRPEWSGVYGAAIALVGVAIAAAASALARRVAEGAAFSAGVLVFWALLAALVTVTMPGASFVFTWPAMAMAAAVLVRDRWTHPATHAVLWIAATVAIFIVIPIVYLMACTALGIDGAGAAVVGLFAALMACLLHPVLREIWPVRPYRLSLAAIAAALVLFLVGAFTVRTTAAHPGAAALLYAVDADSNKAWLTGYASGASSSAALAEVLDTAAQGHTANQPAPTWLTRSVGRTRIVPVPALPFVAPNAAVIGDSTVGASRRVTLHVTPGYAQREVLMTVDAGAVLRAAVNGQAIDTTRYRSRSGLWRLSYTSPPDSGFTLTLDLRPGVHATLALRGTVPGLPRVPGVRLPPRPEHVIPIQNGDMGWIFRRIAL